MARGRGAGLRVGGLLVRRPSAARDRERPRHPPLQRRHRRRRHVADHRPPHRRLRASGRDCLLQPYATRRRRDRLRHDRAQEPGLPVRHRRRAAAGPGIADPDARVALHRGHPSAHASGAGGHGGGGPSRGRAADRASIGAAPAAVGLTTDAMSEGTPGTPFEDEVLIRRRRWASDETGFAIIDADREGDEITLVGTIAHLEERERVRISGQWQNDRRYGLQVKVATAEPLAPTGEAALLVYLKRVRHVGGRRAERLLELYGEDVLEVIDRDPKAAFRRMGLSAGRITEAVKSWDELRSSRALHLLLAPHGLAWLVARIEKHYGPRAHRIVRERPYELTSVFGIGFNIADTIARSVDIPADSPGRARAAVLHVLTEAERAGSTCLPVAELAVRAGELLGVAPDAARFSEMADTRALVIEVDETNADSANAAAAN